MATAFGLSYTCVLQYFMQNAESPERKKRRPGLSCNNRYGRS